MTFGDIGDTVGDGIAKNDEVSVVEGRSGAQEGGEKAIAGERGNVDAINLQMLTPGTTKMTLRSSMAPGVEEEPLKKINVPNRSAATAAALAAATEVEEEIATKGNGMAETTKRGRIGAEPSRLAEYLRRRKKECMGLRQALQTERDACVNAGKEYVLALSDFQSDHSLEITWFVIRTDVVHGFFRGYYVIDCSIY